jgi:hypothetical protein
MEAESKNTHTQDKNAQHNFRHRIMKMRPGDRCRLAGALGILLALAMSITATAQTTISFKYGSSAGETQGGVAIAELQPGWVVTAFCDADGVLKLISWHDSGSALVREGNETTSLACNTYGQPVAITPFNSTTVVTADADPVGNWYLAAWNVNATTGAISQFGTTAGLGVVGDGGPNLYMSITHLPKTSFVATSFIGGSPSNAGGNWHTVTSWFVPSTSTGDFTVGDVFVQNGNFTSTSIASLNSSQFVTASAILGSGDLDVDAWSVNSAGAITKQGNLMGGFAGNPQIAPWFSNTVVTTEVDGSGDNKLISWGVSSTGNVTRQATGSGGVSGNTALCIVTDGVLGALPFTATVGGAGLSVELWETTSTSSTIDELASYNTTSSQFPTSCAPINTNLIVSAAYNDSSDDLVLEEWYEKTTRQIIP